MNKTERRERGPIESCVIEDISRLSKLDIRTLPTRTLPSGYIMCRPDHFCVQYEINQLMKGNTGQVNRSEAILQWMRLRDILRDRCRVTEIPAEEKYPDMVFAANGALTFAQGGKRYAIMVCMKDWQRKGEWRHYGIHLSRFRYELLYLSENVCFEGEGDARFDPERKLLWAGYGFRSSRRSHPVVSALLKMPVVPLRLVDRRFYHLDTCFLPFLADGRRGVMYYPDAFDAASLAMIRQAFSAEDRIEVSEEEASHYACNAPVIGSYVVMPEGAPMAAGALKERGFEVNTTPMSEFLKAGGGAKCLVLEDYWT